MNPELLLAHFNRISDSPDAISHLRRFILDLAVRGKLVEQDPHDEPASQLLQRIREEKARLATQKTPQHRGETERSQLVAPRGWVVTTLGEVAHKITDGAHKTPTYLDEGVPFISVKNFSGGKLDFSHTRLISPQEHAILYKRCDPRRGDILIGRIGTLGKAVLVDTDQEFSLFVSVGLIRFNQVLIAPLFFRLVLNSPLLESEYNRIKVGGGTHTNKLNLGDLHGVTFPLPPLAEQQRIVAKVEELMCFCDQLEAAKTERETRRDRLSAASHYHLNNGGNAEASRKNVHFYISRLPTITTRSDQIPALREAILNLSVRGRIVPQDEKDELVSVLLKRIRAGQERLISTGAIPRPKPLPLDCSAEVACELPSSWEKVNFGDLCNVVTSGSRGWAEYYSESGPKFIRAQNIRFGRLRLDDLACVNPPKKSEGTRTQVSKGDLLVVITGAGVTNPALLHEDLGEAYVSQHVGLIKPTDTRLSRWLLLCLMAPMAGRAGLVKRAYGAGKPGLNLDNIRSLPIPLPPLAEQCRIVGRVDELMALCDRLEAQLTAAQTESRRLLEAVLHHALVAAE
jgi:type I restriction enzyme S subunit